MKTVLVVDDVPEVSILLKTKLERTERFTVFSAGGGKEALRLAEDLRPDIIVCDIDMPDIDGPALAQKITEKPTTKNIPLIFLSSLVTPRDAKQGNARWRMISKQSPVEELIKAIDEVLGRAR
jgi:CheY-like chemotaxis protein